MNNLISVCFLTWDLRVTEVSLHERVAAEHARCCTYGLMSVCAINQGTLEHRTGKIPGFISQWWKEASDLMPLGKSKHDCDIHKVKPLGEVSETSVHPVLMNHVQERGTCTEIHTGGLLEKNRAYLQEYTWNICLGKPAEASVEEAHGC